MIQLIVSNLPVVVFISIFLMLWSLSYFVRRYYRLKNLRSPFSQNLLRSPGQSLLRELDCLNREITVYTVILLVVPMFVYAAYISHLHFYNKPVKPIEVGLASLFCLGLICISLYKLTGLLHQRRRVRLGYDGEVAVGQALNQLLREGYHVYHDFPANKFNIDHIVVGPKGVFAVETKTRSNPDGGRRKEAVTVEYNGRVLHFPERTDSQSVEQAQRNANWLSKWIGSSIGEPVAVRGIVALPGWSVKRTSADGIPVVNPKQFPSLFKHIQPRTLSQDTINRIVYQLEQRCRDVEPLSVIYDSAD